jgi:hypothetical protein
VVAASGDYTAAQVGAIPTTAEGAASGVATLDGTTNVPLAQLGNVPAAPVATVFGRTGAVVATSGDYTAAQVGAIPTTAKGAASGVATLDGTTNVPLAQLGNVPAAPVATVFGRTGAVVATSGDYTAAQVGAIPTTAEGAASGVATLDGTANVPLAQLGNAPLGTGYGLPSIYLCYANGGTYYIRNWFTGAVAYSSTSAATIANDLGTLLQGSTLTAPISCVIDPTFNLTGQTWSTYCSGANGGGFCLWGFGGGEYAAANPSNPNMGSFTLGASGQTGNISGCSFYNLTFETETIVDYGPISDITHHNCSYRGINSHAIVMNNVSTGGIQYIAWTGVTAIQLATADALQDFILIEGLGSTASLGHMYFEYVRHVGGTTNATFSFLHIANGTKWHRVEFGGVDLNTNQSGYTPTLIQFDGGASSTFCPAILFGFVHWENHQTGTTSYVVQCGSFTGGALLKTGIVIDAIWINTNGVVLFNNGGAVWDTTLNGLFLDIRSLTSQNVVTGTGPSFTPGTWAENASYAPISIGPVRGAAAQTVLNTSYVIANPVSSAGAFLSVAGTASFATGTTYTVGGTPMGVFVTGTVTVKTSDGTTLMSAQAVTNQLILLLPGMTFLLAATGTATFFKGV